MLAANRAQQDGFPNLSLAFLKMLKSELAMETQKRSLGYIGLNAQPDLSRLAIETPLRPLVLPKPILEPVAKLSAEVQEELRAVREARFPLLSHTD